MVSGTLDYAKASAKISQSFGYDAVASNGRRKSRGMTIKSEDSVLNKSGRKKLMAEVSDLRRNFALLAWAVRKHLDYVSSFNFQSRTGNRELDDSIESFVTQKSRPYKFDIAGRHSLSSYLRILEGGAVINGDMGTVRLKSGHIQAIESDRIQNPPERERESRWVHGVQVNKYGRAIRYGVHSRGKSGSGLHFDRSFPAVNFNLHAYLDRADQVRGISPLSAGINSMIDVYEGVDYSLVKLKVEQLFALAMYRDAEESPAETTSGEDDEGEETGYKIDFGQGPIFLDLDPGDRAEFLKSDNPGGNTQKFLWSVITLGLKALDLPMSFFDEAHTNFFGSRAAWLHYERSCKHKRERLVEGFLNFWVSWIIRRGIISGEIALPGGYRVDPSMWEWVPSGMPWWDPVKEVAGEERAIANGFTTPQAVCKARGTNLEDNIREIARANRLAEEEGVTLAYNVSSGLLLPVEEPDEDEQADKAEKGEATKPENEDEE